jgi:(1->4)-alpha-D-glucan 1-alpha-D-glucosylmutase
LIAELLDTKEDGRIKLFLINQALKARNAYLDLFQHGTYLPLQASGKFAEHVIAFARRQGNQTAIAIAPRFLTRLIQPGDYPIGDLVWADTSLGLPMESSSVWQDVFTGQTLQTDGVLPLGQALEQFPVTLLVSQN